MKSHNFMNASIMVGLVFWVGCPNADGQTVENQLERETNAVVEELDDLVDDCVKTKYAIDAVVVSQNKETREIIVDAWFRCWREVLDKAIHLATKHRRKFSDQRKVDQSTIHVARAFLADCIPRLTKWSKELDPVTTGLTRSVNRIKEIHSNPNVIRNLVRAVRNLESVEEYNKQFQAAAAIYFQKHPDSKAAIQPWVDHVAKIAEKASSLKDQCISYFVDEKKEEEILTTLGNVQKLIVQDIPTLHHLWKDAQGLPYLEALVKIRPPVILNAILPGQ